MTGLLLPLLWLAQVPPADAVFERVRRGDLRSVSQLAAQGPALAAAVKPFLADRDERVRREAVILLSGWGGEESCGALSVAFSDPSADVRERALSGYGQACAKEPVTADRAALVERSVALGNTAAVADLLLARAPDAASRLSEPAPGVTLRWAVGEPPVPGAWVRQVARARFDETDRARLRSQAARPSIEEARFLLAAIEWMDDAEVLQSLQRLLDDTRRLPNERRRRVCDLAVDAWAKRSRLPLSFQPQSTVYSDAQRAEVRRALAAHP
jgi:hypothetical protein